VSEKLSPSEVKTLKSRFCAAECEITDIDDTSFEIVHRDLPVRTHVFVNPYYVQLATYIYASQEGSAPNSRNKAASI
jgi:hypothetical protein